ncbi:MAG TPA: aminopeptidase [Burkholderiales bacterium]|nr:aminopeptidase [Burkholderiales bacterium]
MIGRFVVVFCAVLLLAGCDSLAYYRQAIGGHFGVMQAARPLDDWLADPATPETLRGRLVLAGRIREFASRELALPENGSYRSYAELKRPYVVWNVFAAPRFSVKARKECFPFTGCVSYRGFFSEEEARRHAEALRIQGFDVHVGGVPAYSTLGWFDDPLLSTFIRYPDAQLARLVFHELAHQVAYAPSDTSFNESFAATVEQEGVRRWLRAEGRMDELEAFLAAQARRRDFARRVKETRAKLAEIYASDLPPAEMAHAKAAVYETLREAYPKVVPAEANNAFLLSVSLYTEHVPAFERLLRESASLPEFYAQVRELARNGGLKRLKPPGPAAARTP